jgi:hypothetical protein
MEPRILRVRCERVERQPHSRSIATGATRVWSAFVCRCATCACHRVAAHPSGCALAVPRLPRRAWCRSGFGHRRARVQMRRRRALRMRRHARRGRCPAVRGRRHAASRSPPPRRSSFARAIASAAISRRGSFAGARSRFAAVISRAAASWRSSVMVFLARARAHVAWSGARPCRWRPGGTRRAAHRVATAALRARRACVARLRVSSRGA